MHIIKQKRPPWHRRDGSIASVLTFAMTNSRWVVAEYTYIRTGKSFSEALVFASTNPQYDDRLFIELQVQYMKIPSSNLGRTCCVQKMFLTFRTIFVHNMFSPCPAKRRDSDKDLPVLTIYTSNVFTSYTAATTLKNSHNFVAIIVNTAECKSHARFPHSLGFRQSQLCMNWSVILQTLNIMTLSKEKLTSLV